LGQNFFVISNFAGQKLYIPNQIYLENIPAGCLINIYTLPDDYFKEKGLDIILGQTLLRNYYTIYDLSSNQIGFYVSAWTLTEK